MGIYTDTCILGLRILIEMLDGSYSVKYTFSDSNWKQRALLLLPQFINKNGVIIQTLHAYSTTCIDKSEQDTMWIDNHYITIQDLL